MEKMKTTSLLLLLAGVLQLADILGLFSLPLSYASIIVMWIAIILYKQRDDKIIKAKDNYTKEEVKTDGILEKTI